MRNILVLGGTRFFGRRLVEKLVNNGDQVTVYDQICYAPDEADVFLKSLGKLTQKLIFTSTQSVYAINGFQSESDFDPKVYPIRMGSQADFSYGEGKRLAEAVYFQTANFPVTAVRLPYVLGPNDYTKRLDFHIQRVINGQPIVAKAPTVKNSLISSEEAAEFLFWIGNQSFAGPINACADGDFSISELVQFIEDSAGMKAELRSDGDPTATSPYSQQELRCLVNAKAKELGFNFTNAESWLPELVKEQTARLLG